MISVLRLEGGPGRKDQRNTGGSLNELDPNFAELSI